MELRFASSGALAAELTRQEFESKTAKEIKRILAGKLGISRHIQRLMQEHVVLPDDKRFDGKETMLQLVLLPFQQGDATSLRKMAMAAYSNDVATLEQLLDLPLDPDECFPNGFCPLLGAVDAGCVEAVRVLLEAGATVNKVDRDLDSPLAIAALVFMFEQCGTYGIGLALVAALVAAGRWGAAPPTQAWHLVTAAFILCGGRSAWRHLLSFCVAGVALTALGWLWWRPWSRLVAGAPPLSCVAGVALGDICFRFV
eukprot:s3_g3.t1